MPKTLARGVSDGPSQQRVDAGDHLDRRGVQRFYAGPEVHIVDALALTDPLLARLPPYYQKEWTAGHLERLVPDGYIETQLSGRNELVDPKLNAYYDKLALVTRGPLFSRDWTRMGEIWRFNTGQYDDLIDYDFYRFSRRHVRKRSSHLGPMG